MKLNLMVKLFYSVVLGIFLVLNSSSLVSASWVASGSCSFSAFGYSYSQGGSRSFSDEASCRAYLSRGNAICADYSGGLSGAFTLTQGCTGSDGRGDEEGGGEKEERISEAERQRREQAREEELRKQSEERIKREREKAKEDFERTIREAEETAREESEAFRKEQERLEMVRQEKASNTFKPLFGRTSGSGVSRHGYPRGSYLAEDAGEFNIRLTDGTVNLINIGTGQQAVFGGIGVHLGQEIVLPPINPSGLSKKSTSGPPPKYSAKLKGAENVLEADLKNLKDPKTGQALLGLEIKVREDAQPGLVPAAVEIQENGKKIGEMALKFDVEERGETDFYLYKVSDYKAVEDLKSCFKNPATSCCDNPAVFERMPDACFKVQSEEGGGIPSECLDFLDQVSVEEQIVHPENIPEKCRAFAAQEVTEEELVEEESAETLKLSEQFYDSEGEELGFFRAFFIKTYIKIYSLFTSLF